MLRKTMPRTGRLATVGAENGVSKAAMAFIAESEVFHSSRMLPTSAEGKMSLVPT
jgi:hypothetical protein